VGWLGGRGARGRGRRGRGRRRRRGRGGRRRRGRGRWRRLGRRRRRRLGRGRRRRLGRGRRRRLGRGRRRRLLNPFSLAPADRRRFRVGQASTLSRALQAPPPLVFSHGLHIHALCCGGLGHPELIATLADDVVEGYVRLELSGNLRVRVDRFPRALRDARVAVNALVRADKELVRQSGRAGRWTVLQDAVL